MPSDHRNDEDLKHHHHSIPKTANWQTAGLLMIADVVGCGVMSLATAFAQLGWALALPSLLFWGLVSAYVGTMVGEANQAFPDCENFMQLAGITMGRRARTWTAVCVYSFIFLCLGDYLLILGETMEMMVNSKPAPPGEVGKIGCSKFVYTVLTALALLPFARIRQLGKANWLMILNSITILFSVGFALLGLYLSTHHAHTKTEWIASQLTIFSFFHSQALFAFSFSGAFIYLEIVSEMANARDFNKALFWCSVPFQCTLYTITGVLGYWLIGSGSQGLLIRQIPSHQSPLLSALYQLSALGLFIHLIISYVVKSTILARAAHSYWFPHSAGEYATKTGDQTFVAISCLLVLGSNGKSFGLE
ncbi:hypothetical protein BASA81_001825 [Batrachochytrium salamandrivorans]|nr:hypothetical protein BASA81_001825 [Batrachochytrium salamandrivorans]